MAFIEPCCCHKQLPAHIQSDQIYFQTYGDVTLEQMLSSVAYMIDAPFVLMLAGLPIEAEYLKIARHYFNRGWISAFIMLYIPKFATTEPAFSKRLVEEILGDYLDKVHIVSMNARTNQGQMTLFSNKIIHIQGSFCNLLSGLHLSQFSSLLIDRSRVNVIDAAISPTIGQLKLHKQIVIDGSANADIHRVLSRNYFPPTDI